MTRFIKTTLFILTVALSIITFNTPTAAQGRGENGGRIKAPDFPLRQAGEWLNSAPLSLKDLRGKVVMVDFWTYGCWNCYRSFPWMNEMEARFEGEDFIIIGVHTPEFDREKNRDEVIQKIAEFGLKHPIMVDNDFKYWRAMDNHFWPSYYLIDKRGYIRKRYVGETHAATPKAIEIENRIKDLLKESE